MIGPARRDRPTDTGPQRKHSRWRAWALAAASAGALIPMLAPAGASAATVPTVNVSTLEAALQGVPGVTSAQVQALVNDLQALQSGGSAPNLASDLDAVLTAIGQGSGQASLVQPVLNSVGQVVDNLLGGNVSASQAEQIIQGLETASGTSGIAPAVGSALSQLAEALTSADLPALLSQAGSPLSSSDVQTILGELASLESLPADSTIPAGLLSGVAQALDTVAGTPGVPASVASALEGVAGELGSAAPLTSSTLSSVLPTLASTVPSLDSVPITGPALGSLVGGMTDQLASSPPASGGTGGPGGSGANSGQPGSNTYIYYLQSPTVAKSSSVKLGASIHSVTYRGGRLHVAMSCPKTMTGGCKTTIDLSVGSWKDAAKSVKIAAGKSTTVLVGLPHLATVAAKEGHSITVTATTGSYTTRKHTIRIKTKK